MFSGPLPTSKY